MAHIGHPILGDSLYPVPDQVLAVLQPPGPAADHPQQQQQQQQQQQAITPVAVVLPVRTTVQGLYPRLCLHAARLSFRHPVSGEQLTLSALDTVHQQPPFVPAGSTSLGLSATTLS
jgi:23S rRNA-/tRNA-specific pseudouridylate synthase